MIAVGAHRRTTDALSNIPSTNTRVEKDPAKNVAVNAAEKKAEKPKKRRKADK